MIQSKKFFLFLLALLLLVQTSKAQQGDEFNDPQFLRILNNYFGCKTWEDGICVECSERYYFNKKGVCCEIKPQCQIFNIDEGICEQCYGGFQVFDGKCELIDLNVQKNLGCKKWQNGVCLQCSLRWFSNQNRECERVSDSCRTWNNVNGRCQTCYRGYVPTNGQCVIDPNQFVPGSVDGLCAEWKDRTCLRCANRAFFNDLGRCQAVDDQCETWDIFEGFCLSCYKGYDLSQNSCVLSERDIKGPYDLGCAEWDWDKQVCLKCSIRFVMTSSGCVSVKDECAQFNNAGQCTGCFKGYDLQNGGCIFSLSNSNPPFDLGCAEWDWDNQVCLTCSIRFVKTASGCVSVNDQCRTFNRNNGGCTACYKGYEVSNGLCVLSSVNINGPTDLGCAQWDWDNQVCLKCSVRFVLRASRCIPVSDKCQTFSNSGLCTSCYKGYEVDNGICVLSTVNLNPPSDIGCAEWDWDNQICLQCSLRWIMGPAGCIPVSDHCRIFSDNGDCTDCYKGYDLIDGQCIISEDNFNGPTDIGCAEWDWDNQICLQCSQRWMMGRNGKCFPLSNDCASFNQAGDCIGCYKGYSLQDGECAINQITTPFDLGCKEWDWDNQICLQCSNRFVMTDRGCVSVSTSCRTHDLSGRCTSCYKGYKLENSFCVLSDLNNQPPIDLGCASWDWDNQICLQCSNRFVLTSNGCTPVSDNCRTFNSAGDCTLCYKGYEVSQGQCIISQIFNNQPPADSGCAEWDWDNQVCLQCSFRFVQSAGGCIKVADQCNTFDSTGKCTSCYLGYRLNEFGVCEIRNMLCKENDSEGRCTLCYNGFILYKNNCTPLSQLADIALYYAECCPQKLEQLRRDGRI